MADKHGCTISIVGRQLINYALDQHAKKKVPSLEGTSAVVLEFGE